MHFSTAAFECLQKIMNIEFVISETFSLYEKYGDTAYYGENVTQLEHASQCAALAEEEGHSSEVCCVER